MTISFLAFYRVFLGHRCLRFELMSPFYPVIDTRNGSNKAALHRQWSLLPYAIRWSFSTVSALMEDPNHSL